MSDSLLEGKPGPPVRNNFYDSGNLNSARLSSSTKIKPPPPPKKKKVLQSRVSSSLPLSPLLVRNQETTEEEDPRGCASTRPLSPLTRTQPLGRPRGWERPPAGRVGQPRPACDSLLGRETRDGRRGLARAPRLPRISGQPLGSAQRLAAESKPERAPSGRSPPPTRQCLLGTAPAPPPPAG